MGGLILLLVDFLVPAALLWGFLYIFFYIKRKQEIKAKLTEETDFRNRQQSRYSHPVDLYPEDYSKTLQKYNSDIPQEAQKYLSEVAETISFFIKKDHSQLPKDDQFMMADIIYKHIPDTLSQYTEIPFNLRESINENGKTPKSILIENLSLISNKCKQISQSLLDENLFELKSQQNHLKSKFGEQLNLK